MIYLFVEDLACTKRHRSSQAQVEIMKNLRSGGHIRWFQDSAMVVTKQESYSILQTSVSSLLWAGLLEQIATKKDVKREVYCREYRYSGLKYVFKEVIKVTRVLEI